MVRKRSTEFTGRDVFLALTMLVIIAGALYFSNRSTYLRSKAYTQTATGVRIEAEEMTRSDSVIAHPEGYITF